MKAIILAAGRGSRMRNLTEDRPKALVEMAGRSLLDLQIAALRGGGASDIAAVRGYRGDKLEGRGLTLFDNPRWAATNMIVSLRCAATWLRASPCLVSYSDIFYPAETVRRLIASPGDLLLSYDPNWLDLWKARFDDPLSDAEAFRLDGRRLIEIGGRANSVGEIEGQYMGLLKFTPIGWEQMEGHLAALAPAVVDKLDVTGLLSRLIAAGVAVHAVPTAPGWGEVDSETDLAYYAEKIATGQIELPKT
jgi:choline kinase